MQIIESITQLEDRYGLVSLLAIDKVCDQITPLYRRLFDASRFVVLSTVSAEGTDASPRGDRNEVVRIINPKTLYLPDWKGNNWLDSLKNIVIDGRLSLMFMAARSDAVVRVNGSAIVTADVDVTGQFEH